MLFGTVIPKFTSIITLPIITAMLTKAELGSYDVVLTTGSMLLPIAVMQMHSAAFRFLMETKDSIEEKKTVISNILFFVSISSVVALIILYFCLDLFIPVSNVMKICIVMYLFTDVMVNVLKQIARGLLSVKVFSTSTVINAFTELIFIVILVQFAQSGLFGAVLALVLGQLFASVYVVVKLKIHTYIDLKYISKEKIKTYLNYSWPLIPSAFSSWIVNSSDKIIITTFLGLEAAGINAVAVKLPNMFSYAQSAFNLAWQENATMSMDDSDSSEYYGKVFDSVLGMLVGIMAMIIAAAPLIFMILIKGDYDEAYIQMAIRFIAVIFSSMSAYLGGIYVAHMKSKQMGFTTILAAILNLILNLILIQVIGLYATAISSLVAYLCLTLYRMRDIQKFQKVKFNYKKMAILVFGLLVMSVLCSMRTMLTNGINIILCVILVIIPNRAMIKVMIAKVKKKFLKKG